MPVNRISRFGFVNAYLVEEEDGLTLIDTMIPRSSKAILAAAEKTGKPITTILLTHAHGDHVGSLDELHAALPEAAVVISERDSRYLDKVMTLDPGEPQASCAAATPARRRSRRGRSRPASGSARSRSSPLPATRPATSPSSTPATAPSTPATRTRPSAASRPRPR